jgi:hypothetical protein
LTSERTLWVLVSGGGQQAADLLRGVHVYGPSAEGGAEKPARRDLGSRIISDPKAGEAPHYIQTTGPIKSVSLLGLLCPLNGQLSRQGSTVADVLGVTD